MGEFIATLLGFITVLAWIDIMAEYPSRLAKFCLRIFPLLLLTFLGSGILFWDFTKTTWIQWLFLLLFIRFWIWVFEITFNTDVISNGLHKLITFKPTPKAGVIDSKQDPNGFADLRFGETLENIQSSHPTQFITDAPGKAIYLILVSEAQGSCFFRGAVAVRGIFWNNELGAILIPFDKKTFAERLNGLRKIMGEYDGSNPGVYKWQGPFSIIMLGKMNEEGILSIFRKSNEKDIKA